MGRSSKQFWSKMPENRECARKMSGIVRSNTFLSTTVFSIRRHRKISGKKEEKEGKYRRNPPNRETSNNQTKKRLARSARRKCPRTSSPASVRTISAMQVRYFMFIVSSVIKKNILLLRRMERSYLSSISIFLGQLGDRHRFGVFSCRCCVGYLANRFKFSRGCDQGPSYPIEKFSQCHFL